MTDKAKPKTIGRLSKYEMEACIRKVNDALNKDRDAQEETLKLQFYNDPNVIELAKFIRKMVYGFNRKDFCESLFTFELNVQSTEDQIREAIAEELRDDKIQECRKGRYSKTVQNRLVFKAQELSTFDEIVEAVIKEVSAEI